MSHDSILMIVNPVSGKGCGLRQCEAVVRVLREHGADVVVQKTRAKGDAERIAEEAARSGDEERPGIVAACGGDGCVQEVAGALARVREEMGDRCPSLGLVPAGRCNDFARAMNISMDPKRIAEALICGSTWPMDLGRIGRRYFCTVATLGVDATISDFVDRMRLPLRGTAAYLFGAMCVLARFRPPHVRLEGSFGKVNEPLLIASVANTSSYGGSIPIVPKASPVDGLLDLCLIQPMSKLRLAGLIPQVLRGKHEGHRSVRLVKVDRLTVDAELPLTLWADGEAVAKTPAMIEVAQGAVQVVMNGPLSLIP